MNSDSHHYRPPKRKATASVASFKAETSSSDSEDEGQIKPETRDSIQSAAAVKEKGKPGRKRINHVDPENKRIAQNRVAQRAYRERQLNHAKELEAKVAELSERLAAKEEGGTNHSDLLQELESLRTRNAELSIRLGILSESAAPQKIEAARITECPECANLREKYARLETHVSLLQTQLQLLEKSGGEGVRLIGDEERYGRESLLGNGAGDPSPQIQSALEFMTTSASSSSLSVSPMAVPPTWSPQIQMSTCSASPIISESSQQNEKVPSSADLFGPPIVDTLRTQLKELKSLANTRFVDDYVDTFVDQTKCTDSKSAKQNLMKLVVVRRKLLDACHAVLDRRSCIEICESFKEINKQHLNYMYKQFYTALREKDSYSQSGSPLVSSDTVGVHDRRAERIVQTVTAQCLNIPALCHARELITELAEILVSQTVGQDAEQFLRLIEVQSKLQALCTSEEDRTSLMLAIEIGRESNRQKITEALGRIDTSNANDK